MATGEKSITCFSDLPLEVRRIIWIFTLPGPRVIRGGRNQIDVPIALSICSESRGLALEYYELASCHENTTRDVVDEDLSTQHLASPCPQGYFDYFLDYTLAERYCQCSKMPMRVSRFVKIIGQDLVQKDPKDGLSPSIGRWLDFIGFICNKQPDPPDVLCLVHDEGLFVPNPLDKKARATSVDEDLMDTRVSMLVTTVEKHLDTMQRSMEEVGAVWNKPTVMIKSLHASSYDWWPKQLRDDSTEEARRGFWLKGTVTIEEYTTYAIAASKALDGW